ncbi:hypothetical protein [Salinibacter ruber]|uniref:hypothetical protein n=1 Tax=Salinibacter ruber TaxID=146919 RepID=UPI002168A9D1|nr:hypothetical protein [Salinibacter ruber]
MENIQSGESGDVAGQSAIHGYDSEHSPANEAATAPSEAVQSGASSPDSRPGRAEPDARESSPSFGECPFCNGYEVQYEHVNEATGEVTPQSFTRPCRRTRCPVCGALNVPYKSSYGQHAADFVELIGAHSTEVKFLSVSLLKEWADEAGIDEWEDSYQVLTGDGGPWSKGRRRANERARFFEFLGVVSARPSDGRAHVHVVLVTDLSVEQIKEAFLRFPLDGHVKTKAPTESTEKFAANCAEYAFKNHAESPSARFTSSRGRGAGYHSDRAVERRREAAERQDDGDQRGREGVEQTNDTEGVENEAAPANGNGQKGDTEGQTTERGPPVNMKGQTYRTREGVMHAVRHYLSRRIGRAVHVNGIGRAELLQVKGESEDLRCVVAPQITDEAVTVAWSEIYTRNVPTVEASDSTSTDSDRSMNDATTDDGLGPNERLQRARERADGDRVVSRFTHERHDGTREITEKYADGTTNTFTPDEDETGARP